MPRAPVHEYLRLGEASVMLAGASLAIRWLPFRFLVRLMGSEAPTRGRDYTDLPAIRRAVMRASRRLPWRTVCFQEGLAAHWMLRARGADSRLHYGIRPEDARLTAHVWVEVNGHIVIGEEERSSAHHCVAVFPPL